MRVSKKSDYALRVLVDLTSSNSDEPVSIRELAKRNDIPKRFLEHIMLDLKEQHWVRSVPGRDGGYILGKDPGEITMGQVVRHFDGLISPIGCVSAHRYEPCSQESVCRFRRILLEIRNHTATIMDRATLLQVSQAKPVTYEEVQAFEFTAGAGI